MVDKRRRLSINTTDIERLDGTSSKYVYTEKDTARYQPDYKDQAEPLPEPIIGKQLPIFRQFKAVSVISVYIIQLSIWKKWI